MRSRRFAWWAAASTAFLGLFILWILRNIGGEKATQAFDDLGELACALSASVACFLASRTERGAGRRAWLFLSAATFSWAAGEAVWSWYELAMGREVPFPSTADIGYLALVPLAAIGMMLFPTLRRRSAGPWRALLDGLIIASGLLFVSWATVLGPIYRTSTTSFLERFVGLAYPVGDLILISIVGFVAARSRRGRTPLLLLGAGLVSLSVADSGFTYLTMQSSYATGNLIDVGWVAGFLLISLGGAKRWADGAAGEQTVKVSRPGELRIFLPYIAAGIAVAVAAWKKAATGVLDPFLFWNFMAVIVFVLVRQMVTLLERTDLERALHRQAMHDPLTSLANRSLFRARVEEALSRLQRTGEPFAVTFLDLDDFKTVNDSLGHEAGDSLLRHVASRIHNATRGMDTVARLGGDEFAILLAGTADPIEGAAASERMLVAIREPLAVGDREVTVGASAGVAFCASKHASADELLANADVAMYRAKANGKDRVEIFEQAMQDLVRRRAELQMDLRRAIEEDQFSLLFQPIVTLGDGTIAGAEALLRWDHPERGRLLPSEFIDVAEECGALVPIGQRTLERSLAEVARWSDTMWVSVNVSTRQLAATSIVEDVSAALSHARVEPHRLVLEISESALLRDEDDAIEQLRRLSALGVRLAIDDFGTGYSSLGYLRSLPLDFVKIDRTFVETVKRSPEDTALVRGIVRLAATLKLTTIAEGVETAVQQRMLRRMGCELVQGFLFARPLEGAEMLRIARSGQPLGEPGPAGAGARTA